MPKKIEELDDEEDEEFDPEEFDEEESQPVVPIRGRPKKELPVPIREERPIAQKIEPPRPRPKIMKDRYVAFVNPLRAGIADAETNEILAEGDFAVLQILANIMGRLERIENVIGSL